MKPILSTEEVRRLEDIIEREGTSKAELKEHAGEFVAAVAQEYDPKEVVVLTGFGNIDRSKHLQSHETVIISGIADRHSLLSFDDILVNPCPGESHIHRN